MGTAISWTNDTWNPTTGCDQISPGCNNCYALTLAKRLKGMGQPKYQNDGDPRTSGPGFGLTTHPDTLDAPLHWKAPRRVFVNSMSDLFHDDVPQEYLAEVFAVMALADRHTFQVLTKRPQRMRRILSNEAFADECDTARFRRNPQRILPEFPPRNVWLGTSIENDRYTFRADHLRATPAAVRFISAEPLLGPLPSLDLTGVDWLIAGCESGPGKRPMNEDWVRDLRDRCQDAGVAFFYKQAIRDGKKVETPELDDRHWTEYPR
jgi:protein gp37